METNIPVAAIPRWAFLVAMSILGVALLSDQWLMKQMPADGTRFGDFYYFLRSLGYLPTWIAFCLLYTLAGDRNNLLARRNSALAIGFTATISAVVAALLKILVRRLDPRPGAEGSWELASWHDSWWDGTDLCFPSEHAAVAWGATIAISRRWHRTAPLLLLMAAGCAAGRVLARAHNPSDVAASLLVALAVSTILEKYFRTRMSN